jgi:phosphoadenosine phosphosulfate reductase
MSVLIDFKEGVARISGEVTVRPAPTPATPANAGHGDVRKKIVPVIKPPAGPSVNDWEGGVYWSAQEWLAAPQASGAVLLQPADDPGVLAGALEPAALVAVDFPRIGDGRGYSQAVLLRRGGYHGPLRAVGAITADQVYALSRVGFTSFGLRADQDAETARRALGAFGVPYQSSEQAPGALSDRARANFAARIRLLERALIAIAERHDRPALASSLSAEDMVISDAISRLGLPIDVFTLDTGRLHKETLDLLAETERRFGVAIEVFTPDDTDVAAYVEAHGENGFYDGMEQRRLCCNIRKVAPLARALAGREAWITGQRREQAATRTRLAQTERDAERNIEKYNPLADWSWADVQAYARRFSIPMSPLYARGYVSIGCEPCTKAIRPGEDPRTGRWWWETQDSKECGLHTNSTTVR